MFYFVPMIIYTGSEMNNDRTSKVYALFYYDI
jgi:hypothetical protein